MSVVTTVSLSSLQGNLHVVSQKELKKHTSVLKYSAQLVPFGFYFSFQLLQDSVTESRTKRNLFCVVSERAQKTPSAN